MTQLIAWSVESGQTPERLRAAIASLDAWEQALPPPDEELLALYEYVHGVLSNEAAPLGGNRWADWLHNANIRAGEAIALRWFPWERARALRVLNLLTADELRHSRQFFNMRGDTMALDRARLEAGDVQGVAGWMRSTMLLRTVSMDMLPCSYNWSSRLLTQMLARSTRIRLALIGYRLEHGELPTSLGDLTGPWFENLPIDPFTGGDFEYFASGAKIELRISLDDYWQDLPAGTPLLWSPGASLTPYRNSSRASLEYWPIERHAGWPSYGNALSQVEALPRGHVMPIPRSQ